MTTMDDKIQHLTTQFIAQYQGGHVQDDKQDMEAVLEAFAKFCQNESPKLLLPDAKPERQDAFSEEMLFQRVLESGDAEHIEWKRYIARKGSAYEKNWIVYVIDVEADVCEESMQVIRNLMPTRSKNKVMTMKPTDGDCRLVLCHKLEQGDGSSQIQKIANVMLDMLRTEVMTDAYVGVGCRAETLHILPESYTQAVTALKIGKMFKSEKRAFYFDKLGIERIVCGISQEDATLFLQEILADADADVVFDEQTLFVAQKLFENDLNVSEAARKAHFHRNSILYRLAGIEKATGLDIKKFHDAMLFKLAFMVYFYKGREGQHT